MLNNKAKELMKQLLNLDESYEHIKNTPQAETLGLFIEEKKNKLIKELGNE